MRAPDAPPQEVWTFSDARFRPRPSMVALFGNRNWRLVEEGFDPSGCASYSGKTIFDYVVLEDHATDQQVVAGRGEARTYAGLDLPRRPALYHPRPRA